MSLMTPDDRSTLNMRKVSQIVKPAAWTRQVVEARADLIKFDHHFWPR